MSKVNDRIAQVTKQNIENLLCTEDERRKETPWAYRAISKFTKLCGTWQFLVANLAFFVGWIVLNKWFSDFDPFPYTFLLFGVSLEAIFLSILILISQNMDAADSERRHHLDLQMNLLTEREITALMRLVVKVAEKSGIGEEETAEVRSFAHETDPAAVLLQIVKAEGRHHSSPPNQSSG